MYWQVGYEKSGNTWLCFLISHLFDKSYQTWDDYQNSIPNWNDYFDKTKKAPINWVCGHIPFSPMSEYFKDVTGAIYMVRHPLDVALSSMRHRIIIDFDLDPMVLKSSKYDDMVDGYMKMFIANCGDPAFNKMNGSYNWNANVKSWIVSDKNVAVVRYEDLWDDTFGIFTQALLKLDLPCDVLAIKKSVEASSIASMSQLDKIHFIGPAVPGQWKNVIEKKRVIEAENMFGDLASCFGYDFDT